MAKSPPANDPFTDRALKIYEDAKTQIGYVAHRFRQKIVHAGGLAAAKHWLRPSKATAGFQRLLDHDRLDLSVEAVALQPPWNKLFTPAELATARERLAQFGYFTRPATPPTPSTQLSPDELADGANYPEGAKAQITVSAYERNQKLGRSVSSTTAPFVTSVASTLPTPTATLGEASSMFTTSPHLQSLLVHSAPTLWQICAPFAPIVIRCFTAATRQYLLPNSKESFETPNAYEAPGCIHSCLCLKRNTAMQIDKLIRAATERIDIPYFQLPIAGKENPIYRERVYCYERKMGSKNFFLDDVQIRR
jgi:hypothetical protein